MLAGLLFATHDADDRPDLLAATLPFGGVTLIEYQARLLIAAGATQIIVVVARLTPELLGALNRIGRRGASVDAVRTATEASEKLHPLARVLALADGLVTTEAIVATMAGGDGDALLVVAEDEARFGFERVGGGMVWAGIARLDPRRIIEVAALPRDYDMQSATVRVAAQAHAVQIVLPMSAAGDSHGIERRMAALVARGRGVLVALVAQRTAWFDRLIVAPVARLALPPLADRGTAGGLVAVAGGIVGLAGLAAIMLGAPATGLGLVVAAMIAAALGATLGWLRDEPRTEQVEQWLVALLPVMAVLLLGRATSLAQSSGAGWATAIGVVVVAVLGERAAGVAGRRAWWATPPAYPLLLLPFAATDQAMAGLIGAMAYATLTAAAAIEALRKARLAAS